MFLIQLFFLLYTFMPKIQPEKTRPQRLRAWIRRHSCFKVSDSGIGDPTS